MLLIKNGRVIDNMPGGAGDPGADVLIEGGRIVDISRHIPATGDITVVDAMGAFVTPGLVDMHVHLRDPGYEHKEDIITGAAAAAAGGVTTCCCMPNTSPVADSPEVIRYIIEKARHAPVAVLPYGAVTVGQQGRELTDFAALKAAGAIALSDDGNPVQSAAVMRRAMQEARKNDMLIISHCEDAELAQNFAVNEGRVSRATGLPGRPAIAEEIMVARDAMLAAETGARVHIAHVSTAGSVGIIRKAKAAGVRITAETCPQYFILTEEEIPAQGAMARVNPPLRTREDVDAVITGICDGTIDAIATDHAPHSAEEKARPLADAPSGIPGLETSLALISTFLYHPGHISPEVIVRLTSQNPAAILGIKAGTLAIGAAADVVVFDPEEEWRVDPDMFKSKARNSPFAGMTLRGKVKYTLSRGKIVYRD